MSVEDRSRGERHSLPICFAFGDSSCASSHGDRPTLLEDNRRSDFGRGGGDIDASLERHPSQRGVFQRDVESIDDLPGQAFVRQLEHRDTHSRRKAR